MVNEIEESKAYTGLVRCCAEGYAETAPPTFTKHYLANKPEDTDWVVLPVTSFDACFGTTSFSRKGSPSCRKAY